LWVILFLKHSCFTFPSSLFFLSSEVIQNFANTVKMM
jgi:hypothetical protein